MTYEYPSRVRTHFLELGEAVGRCRLVRAPSGVGRPPPGSLWHLCTRSLPLGAQPPRTGLPLPESLSAEPSRLYSNRFGVLRPLSILYSFNVPSLPLLTFDEKFMVAVVWRTRNTIVRTSPLFIILISSFV